jgi:nucleoside-diphosphate-sugar epimerase
VKILVTGASGFLGRHVVATLLSRGHAVRALVRPAASVEHLRWPSTVEVARADLLDGPLNSLFLGMSSCTSVRVRLRDCPVCLCHEELEFAWQPESPWLTHTFPL